MKFLKKNQDVVIVLGMHRSGTSCLTGLLQQCGLELGEVIQKAPSNKKGNRENRKIMALNNKVLAYNQASWDNPPSRLSHTHKNRKQRDKIIASYKDHDAWGFKDPRILFTLPFWLGGLKRQQIHFIGTFRHPLAVAKSLNARDPNMTIEHGLSLWRQYNQRLLAQYQERPFPVVNFNQQPEAYLQAVSTAIEKLNLFDISISNLDFFDNTLRHQTSLDEKECQQYRELLQSVLPLYEKLIEII